MPSSPPSESPSPSPQIRQWQHSDSPFLWSNAIVGSLILHLLILVPISRIGIGERSTAATEKLIAVEVISSPASSPPESFPELISPPNSATPPPLPPTVANKPATTPGTSSKPATPTTPNSPTPTPTNPASPEPTPTPTPSSPTPEPTPTPSSPTPEPTAEPTREPDPQPTGEPPGGNDSPSGNDPPVTDEFPPDDPGSNPGVLPDSSPPSEDTGGTSGGTGDGDTGATEGFVAYQRSGLPAGGCGGSCPDSPAQPQITPGQQFAITYAPTQRYCSGTNLAVTVVVNAEGTIEPNSEASGDACEEIARSVVSNWSFQPAETGGSPVFSVLEIDLEFL